MSHTRYIGIIALSGLFAWISWWVVYNKLSPYEHLAVAVSFFFLTLFVALVCTFTVLGFYFRMWLFKNEIFYKHINVSFRQGLFLGVLAILCLILQWMKILNWFSGLLLIVAIVLLESFFSAKDSEY